ncbi:hypothetical protein APHAL10511_001687 [Amanita phalloides]|nr:hypothetical protein APHAL10511_001687 [Amanita phalloides]
MQVYSSISFSVIITNALLAAARISDLDGELCRQREIEQYLSAHNDVRIKYDVPPLRWSEALARMADTWADNCQFKHSNGSLNGEPYGENIVAATGPFPIVTALQLFSSDAVDYNPLSPTYNHFTQVVWKSTRNLGCSYSECDGIFDQDRGPAIMYVCVYEPPGNIVGQATDNVPEVSCD